MPRPYLFFDLDGTLTDPAQGICGCIRYALEKGGYPAEPLEAYHPWIGPPLLQSFMDYLQVSETEGKRLLALYRERFSTIGLFENIVYPGIPELLRAMQEAGVKMAVTTGKPTVYAERILEHFGLAPYFDFISGIRLSEAPLGKDGVIAVARKHFGNPDPAQIWMVGDRHHDAEGARLHQIDCIYVLYGYGSEAEAAACQPAHTVKTVEMLRSLLLQN